MDRIKKLEQMLEIAQCNYEAMKCANDLSQDVIEEQQNEIDSQINRLNYLDNMYNNAIHAIGKLTGQNILLRSKLDEMKEVGACDMYDKDGTLYFRGGNI